MREKFLPPKPNSFGEMTFLPLPPLPQWLKDHALLIQAVREGNQMTPISTGSSDAKPAKPTTRQLIQEMATMEPSSSTYQLGELVVELDILITTLTKRKEMLLERYMQNEDGHPGQNVLASLNLEQEKFVTGGDDGN